MAVDLTPYIKLNSMTQHSCMSGWRQLHCGHCRCNSGSDLLT